MSTPSIESILSTPDTTTTEKKTNPLVSSQLESISSVISGGKNTSDKKLNTSFIVKGQITTFAQEREKKQQNRRKPDSV